MELSSSNIQYDIYQSMTLNTFPSISLNYNSIRTDENGIKQQINNTANFFDWREYNKIIEHALCAYSIILSETVFYDVWSKDKENEKINNISKSPFLIAIIKKLNLSNDEKTIDFKVQLYLHNSSDQSTLLKTVIGNDNPDDYMSFILGYNPNMNILNILYNKVAFLISINKTEKPKISFNKIDDNNHFICLLSKIDNMEEDNSENS